MKRLGFLIIFLSLASRPHAQARKDAPPERVCLPTSAILSDSFFRRYFRPGAARNCTNDLQCNPSCDDYDPKLRRGGTVSVDVECRPGELNGDEKKTAVIDPTTGLLVMERLFYYQGGVKTPMQDGEWRAEVWDDDTPCQLSISLAPPNGKARGLAMAKELAATLTPELFKYPTYELLVAADDETGEAAKREAAAWDAKKDAASFIYRMGPGWPRTDVGTAYRWLAPTHSYFSFGLCPNAEGTKAAKRLAAIVPNLKVRLVQADREIDTSQTCPQYLGHWHGLQTEETKVKGQIFRSVAIVPDKDHPLATKSHVESKLPVARWLVSLSDKTGTLLDWKTTEVPYPSQEPLDPGQNMDTYPLSVVDDCGAATGPASFGLGLVRDCDAQLRGRVCTEPLTHRITYQVRAKTNRLAIKPVVGLWDLNDTCSSPDSDAKTPQKPHRVDLPPRANPTP